MLRGPVEEHGTSPFYNEDAQTMEIVLSRFCKERRSLARLEILIFFVPWDCNPNGMRGKTRERSVCLCPLPLHLSFPPLTHP